MTNTPGTTELRNNAIIRPIEPDVDSSLRIEGELWVNSVTLSMYVFSFDMDGEGTKGWIGVTSGQNNGSIIYSGDNPPTLAEVYPNLQNYNLTGDIQIDPLPGTVWYDTKNQMLKIYYVTANTAPTEEELGIGDEPINYYTANWVSVTTSHYLTEATASLVNDLTTQVADLTATVAQLESIINP
jgi:hypothetical protein